MQYADDEVLDLPSIPRVRSSAPGSGGRSRKSRRGSRWSDAAPSELPPAQQDAQQDGAAVYANGLSPNAEAELVPREEKRRRTSAAPARRAARRSSSPSPRVPKEEKRRARPRKVVRDDDDDDDEDEDDYEEVHPEQQLDDEEDDRYEVSSPEIQPTVKKVRGRGKGKKMKKKVVKRVVEELNDEVPPRDSDEVMSPDPMTPMSGSDSPHDGANGARAGGRLTSRQRALQGEKVELEYGKLDSPKHKKKGPPKDEWTPDEDRELKRQQKARLRQMVNEKKSKEKRSAMVDKVLRGVTSKRKKISAASEAVAARADDRLVDKGVPEGFVRYSSGQKGDLVAVHPGGKLPEPLSFGSMRAEYPRPCTRDPRTGKRVFIEV